LKNLEGSGGFKNQFFGKTLSLDNQAIDKFGIGVCLSHLLMVVLQFFEKKVFDLGLNDVKIKVIADGKIKLLEALDDELLVEIKKQNNLDLEIDKYFWKNILEEKSSDLFSDTNKNKRVVFDLIRENKADDRYLSVAVGSILAKVERDGFMENLDKKYPDFGWVKNKGYGTKENLKTIEKNLDNPYLRKTFLKRFFE
jgi:ribonuclease HII